MTELTPRRRRFAAATLALGLVLAASGLFLSPAKAAGPAVFGAGYDSYLHENQRGATAAEKQTSQVGAGDEQDAGYGAQHRENDQLRLRLNQCLAERDDLDAAARYSTEALRLGSKDPLLLYHAGAIAAKRGEAAPARAFLTEALKIDAGFSATGAADARSILDGLK